MLVFCIGSEISVDVVVVEEFVLEKGEEIDVVCWFVDKLDSDFDEWVVNCFMDVVNYY